MTGITSGENNRRYIYFWKKKVPLVLDVSICALMVHQPRLKHAELLCQRVGINPQKKPFNRLLHTKNTAFNNLWGRWILWILWVLWILWCKRSSSCEFDGSRLVTQQLCSAQLLYRLRSGAIMQRGRNLLCESKMSPQCTLTVALLQTHRPTSTGWNLTASPRSVAGLRDQLTAGRRKLQLWDRKTEGNGYFFLDIKSVSLKRKCLIWWSREDLL